MTLRDETAHERADQIYREYRERVEDFVFDERVAAVFDDMVRRSVPGYATVNAMTQVFAEHYSQPDSVLYDLGCSLGAGTAAMRRGVSAKGCKIVAVDNSPAMVQRCRDRLAGEISDVAVDVVEGDIRDVAIENGSVAALNYVLQFLAPEDRDEMIGRIYEGLRPGGVLLLSEKVCFGEPEEESFQVDMYHHFKHLMGYSRLEISQKRKALEHVLVPDTVETHRQRLQRAGFVDCRLWFQCFNFVSMVGFKAGGEKSETSAD